MKTVGFKTNSILDISEMLTLVFVCSTMWCISMISDFLSALVMSEAVRQSRLNKLTVLLSFGLQNGEGLWMLVRRRQEVVQIRRQKVVQASFQGV